MFLKNRNIIFKMKISKVTDYAALRKELNDLDHICQGFARSHSKRTLQIRLKLFIKPGYLFCCLQQTDQVAHLCHLKSTVTAIKSIERTKVGPELGASLKADIVGTNQIIFASCGNWAGSDLSVRCPPSVVYNK